MWKGNDMTPTHDELVDGAAYRGKDNNSRRLLLLLSIILLLSMVAVTIGGYLLWTEKQDQAMAGKDLAVRVQAACQDDALRADLGTICSQAKKVEEQVKEGPQGPPGIQGPEGPPGADGADGLNGAPGAVGSPGADGVDGTDGKDGATGPVGPPGKDGVDGKNGVDGKDGTNGTDGKNGDDGRGIASVDCNGAPMTTFTIFYTDGTQQSVDCTNP
jgi:hypothetical protein